MEGLLGGFDDLPEYVDGAVPPLLAPSHHAGVFNADSLAEERKTELSISLFEIPSVEIVA